MRASSNPAVAQVLARVHALESDHQTAGPAHATIDHLGQLRLQQGVLQPDQAATLAAELTSLAELYRRHIEVEDTQVFPAAAACLTAEDRRQIGQEMARRRGL